MTAGWPFGALLCLLRPRLSAAASLLRGVGCLDQTGGQGQGAVGRQAGLQGEEGLSFIPSS